MIENSMTQNDRSLLQKSLTKETIFCKRDKNRVTMIENSMTQKRRCKHTATHCNTLQHTATHCNTLQHTATHCNTLQHTATHMC